MTCLNQHICIQRPGIRRTLLSLIHVVLFWNNSYCFSYVLYNLSLVLAEKPCELRKFKWEMSVDWLGWPLTWLRNSVQSVISWSMTVLNSCPTMEISWLELLYFFWFSKLVDFSYLPHNGPILSILKLDYIAGVNKCKSNTPPVGQMSTLTWLVFPSNVYNYNFSYTFHIPIPIRCNSHLICTSGEVWWIR